MIPLRKAVFPAAAVAVALFVSPHAAVADGAHDHGGGHGEAAPADHGHGAGDHGHGGDAKFAAGHPGRPGEVDRTIRIEAQDIAFDAERIEVRAGETIRFVVENNGQLVHDFTIGTHQTQAAHRDEMTELMAHHGGGPEALADPEVMAHHSHPNALMLAPGETGELIWTFEEAAEVEFACNVPGHYEAGMRGAS